MNTNIHSRERLATQITDNILNKHQPVRDSLVGTANTCSRRALRLIHVVERTITDEMIHIRSRAQQLGDAILGLHPTEQVAPITVTSSPAQVETQTPAVHLGLVH